MMIIMAMMDGANWMVSVPVTSFQLLVAGGALLLCAAVMLALRRRTRVTVAVMRRMEEMGNAKANGKVREMPFTMLGREVRTEE